MKIQDIIQINLKKLKKHKVSALFLIIPITLLVILSIVISSQVANIREASEESVLGTAQDQSKLIEIKKDTSQFQRRGFGANTEDLFYTENDVEAICAVDHVSKAQILSPIPINNIETLDLFKDKTVSISQIIGLDPNFATLYTDQDFTYNENEPIPIVLNANGFVEIYEDWGGKNEVIISRPARGAPGENTDAIENLLPIKSRAIEYNKDDLINKEIKVKFGDLDAIQNYEREMTSEGLKLTKLTATELKEKQEERKTSISKYWDYKKISAPIEYTFKIVGVAEDEGNRNTYVPEEFVNQLMQAYIKHQLDARNKTSISTTNLASFSGLEYDGNKISSSTAVFGGTPGMGPIIMGGRGTPRQPGQEETTINIPGLVIKNDKDDEIIGECKDAGIYESSAKNGQEIVVMINDIVNRETVIKELNKMGYAYVDLSDLNVFAEIQSTLNTVSMFTIIGFIALSIIIIIFTMGKFITESKREIGIFRAIGSKRSDIKVIFMIQATLYVLIGYLSGLILGIVINYLIAKPIHTWFTRFIDKTIGESFGVVNYADSQLFTNINLQGLLIYSAILFVVTILVSIIPATKASKISPVEAIKGE